MKRLFEVFLRGEEKWEKEIESLWGNSLRENEKNSFLESLFRDFTEDSGETGDLVYSEAAAEEDDRDDGHGEQNLWKEYVWFIEKKYKFPN